MNIANSVDELRAVVAGWRRAGETISFVPTMGNLHDGHITLLLKARELATRSVVSIFVNPIQFGRGEDYAKYPSTLESDKQKLQAAGLDLLFAPDLNELYPGGIEEDTRVTVPGLSSILCGQYRPGHFSGVATVVTKLLMNVQPDLALFGDKDYQQVMVIKQMVHDLLMPVKIVGQPIVREADGLAMSSRNSYLNAAERALAPQIFQAMNRAREKTLLQNTSLIAIETAGMAELAAAGFRPEYFSIRRAQDLSAPQVGDTTLQLLVAAWLGPARLIDNLRIELPEPLKIA
ncbi:MAG: pantoate--beta-alanine ligase [Gammaproteobacteria bacterium]|jgi:pantoate--beta-alanine ligase|nr:pantoate--beta-alanine ligase [Gammaproteobacteria bacterium]